MLHRVGYISQEVTLSYIGGKGVIFMSEEMENQSPQTIKVIYCEPGRKARIAEIGTELSDLQRAVGGGFIETYYPFEEEVCIVCNV